MPDRNRVGVDVQDAARARHHDSEPGKSTINCLKFIILAYNIIYANVCLSTLISRKASRWRFAHLRDNPDFSVAPPHPRYLSLVRLELCEGQVRNNKRCSLQYISVGIHFCLCV